MVVTPGDLGSVPAYPLVVVIPIPRVLGQPRPVARHRPRSARTVWWLRCPAALALGHLHGRVCVPVGAPTDRSRTIVPLGFPLVVDLRGSERCAGGELCFAGQCALLIAKLSALTGTPSLHVVGWTIVPLILLAHVCCW
jgi:hypothetical protein